jgi:hypothetical protein
VLGEIVVTSEKLSWLIKAGEAADKPSQIGAGGMVRELFRSLPTRLRMCCGALVFCGCKRPSETACTLLGTACVLPQAFYKSARVEFIPVGVVGAIVPWKWPFHNWINIIICCCCSRCRCRLL